jgi:isorenieratene synthase
MLRSLIEKQVRKKLNDYKVALNMPDHSLPLRLQHRRRVAVVGAGIAGISAASNLGERGFMVDLFEKAAYAGGKLGSWQFESNGATLRTEHGFHAFFKQYYNLLEFMKKIGVHQHLIPIDDYLILYKDKSALSFRNLNSTPLLNVLSMRKTGIFRYRDMIFNRYSLKLLDLFRYDPDITFSKYDHVPLSDFMRDTNVPPKMKLVFSSFARAFFAEPHHMSSAELIKSFHFYFLSNDLGLLYEALDDDFDKTFIQPAIRFMQQNNVTIYLNKPVVQIEYRDGKFYINGNEYDYCVLALDVKHLPILIDHSPSLHTFSHFKMQTTSVKVSARYAVWRIWTDTFEKKKYPFFIFTDRIRCLDSVTFYHHLEKESKLWSAVHQGGIFELHSYALPDSLNTDAEIKEAMLDELFYHLPELKGMKIKHDFFQHRNDFPAFHCGLYSNRPTIKTEVPRLYLAGDWVKMDNCTMLMEAAYTSGSLAANYILSEEGLRENLLFGVAPKGLFT